MAANFNVDGRLAFGLGAGAVLATYYYASRSRENSGNVPAAEAQGAAVRTKAPTPSSSSSSSSASSSLSSSSWEPPRDVVGYGTDPPDAQWPHKARLALNFVVNIEEGSEPSIGDGDGASSGTVPCPSLCARVIIGASMFTALLLGRRMQQLSIMRSE